MPKYIGFTTSPKKYEMIRIRVVLIFVYRSFIYNESIVVARFTHFVVTPPKS